MTVIITGSNGFSAFYLSQFVKENRSASSIIGIDISRESKNHCVDVYFSLADFPAFAKRIESVRGKSRFIHLGGLLGHHPLPLLIEANVLWTSRYLEAACAIRNLESFLNVGSSAEYGVQQAQVLREDLSPHPVSNYGISKHLQSQLALCASRTTDLRVISTRTFNLIGPGLAENLVIGKMIREFKKVREGSKNVVELGRLNSKRDFIDVRDAVKVYWRLSETEVSGEIVNVGSGSSYAIEEIYESCAKIFGITPTVAHNAVALTAQDVDYQKADISKLRSLITLPSFRPVEESLQDMVQALNG